MAWSMQSSPRAWGCFWTKWTEVCPLGVFPTCVGVFLTVILRKSIALRLPHVRGGVSIARALSLGVFSSSPRAWGCFLHEAPPKKRVKVFPTCVGVFLSFILSWMSVIGLPHVRGGVSYAVILWEVFTWSSPRAWGCF